MIERDDRHVMVDDCYACGHHRSDHDDDKDCVRCHCAQYMLAEAKP